MRDPLVRNKRVYQGSNSRFEPEQARRGIGARFSTGRSFAIDVGPAPWQRRWVVMGTRTAPIAAAAAAAIAAIAVAVSLGGGCKGDEAPASPAAGSTGEAASKAGTAAGSAAASAGAGSGAGSAAGPGAAPAQAASCDAIDAGIVSNLTPPDLKPHLTPQIELRLRSALVAACRRDGWSAEALDCAARPPGAARDHCPGKLTAVQERSAQSAIIVEAMTAIAEPLASATPPVQTGPHPDYPTAALAGTDKLFTMVEPERGPKAPIGMTIPRGGLTWTTHEYCTADVTGPVCSSPVTAVDGLWSWRVGRRGETLVVAEERRGPRVERTFVYVRKADGTPLQRVRFDAYGRVDAALLFKGGDRYSGRKRNGANALDGCGFLSYKLDDQKRAVELACLQWQGDPMLDTDGVARTRLVRDAAGFIVEELRFDLAGKPVADADGVHKTLTTRDAAGRPTLERYRGVDDKPAPSTQGCYGHRTERDARGSVVKTICLDASDQPAADPSGISAEAYRVDASGCRTGVTYQSLRGTPAANHDLVHAMEYEVDERCEITSRLCRDLRTRPTACTPGGPARYVARYDDAGNPISVKHFDASGGPGQDPAFHAFELRRTYDRLGNQLTQACYEPTGTKVSCLNTDFHLIKSVYDDAGREVSQTYRDELDRPTDNYGSYKRTYKHDNYDHLVESLNLDESGALTEAFGVAIRKDLFDATHRRFGILLYDRTGQPARNPGCYTGATCPPRPWHAVRIVRRPDGSVEKNLFFDEHKKLLAAELCSAVPCFD
jgi:hypothetical protein